MDQTHERGAAAGGPSSGPSEAEGAPVRRKEPISLRSAIRRARVESLERSEVVTDLRAGAAARLDLLREQLEPVFAQLPADCDLFDLGLTQGETPRLFVDAIAFVETTRNRRGFRFLQDTRGGRILLAESDDLDEMTQAVTDYLARRLIERERALAADPEPPSRLRLPPAGSAEPPPAAPAPPAAVLQPRRRPGTLRAIAAALRVLFQVLGALVFLTALAAGVWWVWLHYGAPTG